MDDPRTAQLVATVAHLRQRIAELEASAESDIRQRTRLTALATAVGLSLANSDSLAGALQQCAEALVTHMGAALARIWTLNERDEVLELQASAGLYTRANGPQGKVPLGQSVIGRIAQFRTPYLTNAAVVMVR